MRDRLTMAIKISVSAVLIVYLLRKIGPATLIQEITSADPVWLIMAILAFSISNLLGALQWFILLRETGVNTGYWSVVQYYYVGLFFNNLLISNMGGDVFRVYYVTGYAQNSSAAVSTVFLDRLFGFTMLTALATVAGIYWFGAGQLHRIGPFLGVLMTVWIGILLVFFNRRFGQGIRFLLKWFMPAKFLLKLRDIYILIHEVTKNRKLVGSVLGLSFLIQMARIFLHFFAGRAVGAHANLIAFMVFIPLIALFASLPISLGGLGVREQSGMFLFQRVGIGAATAISMEFLAYLLSILSSIPGILFFVFINRRRKYNVEEN